MSLLSVFITHAVFRGESSGHKKISYLGGGGWRCVLFETYNRWGHVTAFDSPYFLLVQVQQARIDSEKLSEELGSERRDLRSWEERLKGKKEELEREKTTAEGNLRMLGCPTRASLQCL